MDRFGILHQLSKNCLIPGFYTPISCSELAKRIGIPQFRTASGRANLATRLRRLRAYGLVHRRMDRSQRPARGGPGVYLWSISSKGLQRLSWAKKEGKLPSA
jgi:hypothetical protein